MSMKKVTESVFYIGADDKTLDLFESQYEIPDGVSYNSYIIMDDKIAVMDTVDDRVTDSWMSNLKEVLKDRQPDYLIVSHLEPDHSDNVYRFMQEYPEAKIVGNAKTFAMMPQFFDIDLNESGIADRLVTVKEGDQLSLGTHTLQFVMAPMVHWPEVMVEYEISEQILFSADGFGRFGALDGTLFEDEILGWEDEARRYFINIVGKYGASVQALLKKAAGLNIRMICPLHGPMIQKDLGAYIEKYLTWSSYAPEESGVLVAYASIHGNTEKAAEKLADILLEKGAKNVVLCDLARVDMAEAVAKAFQYDRLALAGITYDGTLMPCMEDFLFHLKVKNFQKRKACIIENGSWGILSGKLMKDYLESMRNIEICEHMVSIKTTLKKNQIAELEEMATELLA